MHIPRARPRPTQVWEANAATQVLRVEPFRPWEEQAAQEVGLTGQGPTLEVRALPSLFTFFLLSSSAPLLVRAPLAVRYLCPGVLSHGAPAFARPARGVCACFVSGGPVPRSLLSTHPVRSPWQPRCCASRQSFHPLPAPQPQPAHHARCAPYAQSLATQMLRLQNELFNLRVHLFHRAKEVLR